MKATATGPNEIRFSDLAVDQARFLAIHAIAILGLLFGETIDFPHSQFAIGGVLATLLRELPDVHWCGLWYTWLFSGNYYYLYIH